MKKVFQTKFGVEGNCFSAAMASLYEDPIECWELASNANDNWREALRDFTGLDVMEVHFDKGTRMTMAHGEFYILGCISQNKLPHVVIGKLISAMNEPMQFEIVHDPLGELKDNYHIDCVLLLYKRFPS